MAADCGGALQTVETVDVKFVTHLGRGNGLNSGGGSTMTCYTPGTTTYEQVTRSVYNFGWQKTGDWSKRFVDVTYNIAKTTGAGNWSYTFSPFNINVEAKMDAFYRQVNGENHLIVRLYNIHSYLVGPTQSIYQNFNAKLYMAGNMSYALVATTMARPPADDGDWRRCLGGWWSGAAIDPCSINACPPGYSNQEPGGGTLYLWGKNSLFDNKFVHNGSRPSRMDGPIEWDLGTVTNFDDTLIYVYGRMMVGGDNYCNGVRWRGGSSYQALAYKVPRINVCPPVLIEIEQDREICENCAVTKFKFEPNDLLGINEGTLQIEYVYGATNANNVNWANAEIAQYTIRKNQEMNVEIPCLRSGSKYCWRAKVIVQQGGFKGESEYTYGCFETLYIPHVTWVVPDISEEECQLLVRGGYVRQFEEKP